MTEANVPEPDSSIDLEDDVTPLRGLLSEFHEIYEELLYVGFVPEVASQILANMINSAVTFRREYEEDFDPDLEDNDEEDESDDGTDEWTGQP